MEFQGGSGVGGGLVSHRAPKIAWPPQDTEQTQPQEGSDNTGHLIEIYNLQDHDTFVLLKPSSFWFFTKVVLRNSCENKATWVSAEVQNGWG